MVADMGKPGPEALFHILTRNDGKVSRKKTPKSPATLPDDNLI